MLIPEDQLHQDWRTWARALKQAIEADKRVLPTELVPYDQAALPNAARAKHHIIVVRDAPGGPTVAISDGVNWNLITSGSASGASGTAVLNFGAFPGSYDTSVAVVGQGSIAAGSVVQVQLRPVATADHTADEHMVENLRVFAGSIVAGVGFTIYGYCDGPIFQEPEPSRYLNARVRDRLGSGSVLGIRKQPVPVDKHNWAPRVYGQWNVSWRWS